MLLPETFDKTCLLLLPIRIVSVFFILWELAMGKVKLAFKTSF